jgi:hypothetical protein
MGHTGHLATDVVMGLIIAGSAVVVGIGYMIFKIGSSCEGTAGVPVGICFAILVIVLMFVVGAHTHNRFEIYGGWVALVCGIIFVIGAAVGD